MGASRYNGAGARNTSEYYARIAADILGLRADKALWDFDDYNRSNSHPWATDGGAGSAEAPENAAEGCKWFMSTGATANGFRVASMQATAFASSRTRKWYMRAKMSCPTGHNSETRQVFGLRDQLAGGNSVLMGYLGSGGNFQVQHSGDFAGSFIDLGVALDAAEHDFEAWCLGADVIHARIDGGAIVTGVQSAAAEGGLLRGIYTGAGASNRSLLMNLHAAMLEIP